MAKKISELPIAETLGNNDVFVINHIESGVTVTASVRADLVADGLGVNGKVDKVTGKGLSTNDYTTAEKNKLAGIPADAAANIQADFSQTDTSADDYIKNKPTNVSDFNNDSGFVTSTVNNLVNYYKKTETYTQAEVEALISAIVTLHIESVSVLPTTDISTTTIYLVPSADPQAQNVKDEYINTDGTSAGWELIGSTAIDLTGYVTDAELTAALADYVTSTALSTALAGYVQKSQTAGLLKNDGTVDTKSYATTTQLAGKQDTISDLSTIRSGASAGATAYQKPSGGIPKTDLASAVQASLGKADSAIQSHQPAVKYDTATQGLTDTEKANARSNIGAGTSNFSGSYNDLEDQPTLGTASAKDVPASGNASSAQVVMGSDTRLTDSRPASDVSSWAKASTKPSYTASEVGAIATTAKGANGGVAELDSSGKVPSSQLPSFVDDVLEYSSKSAFPATGEKGKIYVATDTNKSYRWSGTAYVEISESLALGETSSTAYAGNKGKANADAIEAIRDGSTIDSFSDVETALEDKVSKSSTAGLLKNDGSVDTTAYAKQSEMSVTNGTGSDADKTTIQLKNGTSAKVLKSHQDISGKADKVSNATSGNFAGLDSNGNLTDSGHKHSDYLTQHQDISGKLDKTTYEWNKDISFGSSGYLKIGSFPMGDTNLTIEVDSTTSNSYHGTVIIATQNVSTSSMGSAHSVRIYDDPYENIKNKFRVVWTSGSRNYDVYFVPESWSKNLIHIRACNLYGEPSDICKSMSGTAPSSTTGLEPVNALSTKADKVSGATSGNFAGLDANGNLTDSGKKPGDLLTLGTSSSTAYRGDRGNTAYNHATETRLTTATAQGLYKVGSTAQGHISGLTAVAKSDITDLGIPAQDTTYESKSASSGGTAVSLCTTGEKYTWNKKQNALSSMSQSEADTGTSTTGRIITAKVLTDSIHKKAHTLYGVTMLSSSADLNNYKAPTYSGEYYYNIAGHSISNMPTGLSGRPFRLIVESLSGSDANIVTGTGDLDIAYTNCTLQTLIVTNTNSNNEVKTFRRTYNGNSWSAWVSYEDEIASLNSRLATKTLLWANNGSMTEWHPSWTTGNPAITLSSSIDNYDDIEVYYKIATASKVMLSQKIKRPIDYSSSTLSLFTGSLYFASEPFSGNIYQRTLSFASSTRIETYGGCRYNIITAEKIVDDTTCIPQYIYGLS